MSIKPNGLRNAFLIVIFAMAFTAFALFAYMSVAAAQITYPPAKWWYTSDPSRVAINGDTGAMQAIYPGSAIICSQKSKTERLNVQCYTVFLAQVIPQ